MDLTFVRTSDAVGTQPSVVIDRQGRPYARQRLTTLAGVFSAAASLAIASSASAQASRDPNLVLWHSPDGRYWITFHAWTTNAWLYKSISTTVKLYKLGWCSGPRFPTIACAGYGLALRPTSDQHPRGQRLSLGRTQNEFLF